MASFKQQEELVGNLATTVNDKLVKELNFSALTIPDDSEDDDGVSSILVSSNYLTATRALVIIQNAVGSIMGVFSRSVCIDEGLDRGSMLPYVRVALKQGSFMLLKPIQPF